MAGMAPALVNSIPAGPARSPTVAMAAENRGGEPFLLGSWAEELVSLGGMVQGSDGSGESLGQQPARR
jgi:hypothetical protein